MVPLYESGRRGAGERPKLSRLEETDGFAKAGGRLICQCRECILTCAAGKISTRKGRLFHSRVLISSRAREDWGGDAWRRMAN